MVQIYYEITIYIYKAILPPNPSRAHLPPDPTGGNPPPALPRMEECTFFQGVKSSWGINTAENKDL
jgi:hypothetical protein